MAFTHIKLALLSITIFISIFPATSVSADLEKGFLQCFSSGIGNSNTTAEVILTQNSTSYASPAIFHKEPQILGQFSSKTIPYCYPKRPIPHPNSNIMFKATRHGSKS